jgi:hypothetical protein
MSSSILAALLAVLAASPPVFTGAPSLSALVTDPEGEPTPGAVLLLCPLPDEVPADGTFGTFPLVKTAACSQSIADAGGHAAFRDVPEDTYFLVVSLDGYSNTALFPLPIGRLSPVAPQEVAVVLNPVCFDCVSVAVLE